MRWRCDKDNDCGDMSDEIGCPKSTCSPEEFKCADDTCVSAKWRCDGTPDCTDASDELVSATDVRLYII